MTALKLDFDTPRCPAILSRVRWLTRMVRWTVRDVQYIRTRRGWHVVVRVAQRVTPLSVVAAQAILGSDWRRETFNLVRARHLSRVAPFWRDRWNVLHEPKGV